MILIQFFIYCNIKSNITQLIRLYTCKMEQSAKWASSQITDMRKLSVVCERRIGGADAIKVSHASSAAAHFSPYSEDGEQVFTFAKGWRIWYTGAWWPRRVRRRSNINDQRTLVPLYQRLLEYQSIRIPTVFTEISK